MVHVDVLRAAAGLPRCGCGDLVEDCLHQACGYPWCRPCAEHHRAPECPVDEQGRPLAPCGHPWAQVEEQGHPDVCAWGVP